MKTLPLRSLAETRCDGPAYKLRFHPRLPLLSALSPVRDEAWVWTWDGSGGLNVAAHWSADRSRPRWDDVRESRSSWMASAWHPTDPTLALVDGTGTLRICHGIGRHFAREWSTTDATPDLYSSCAGFCDRGDILWMGGCSQDGGDPASQIVDKSGRLVARTMPCDSSIAIHPEGELLAGFQSDQGATLLRFLRVHEGEVAQGFDVFDTTLVIDVDGYEGLSFSPRGDRFMMMGNAYEIFVAVHAFPSLRRELILPLEEWKGLEDRLGASWAAHRWDIGERAGFAPDGEAVVLGSFAGHVVEVSLHPAPSIRVAEHVHHGPIAALQTRAFDGMMATADFSGHIRLCKLPHQPVGPDRAARGLTTEFVARSKVVDPWADWDDLRLLDGVREWDLDRIGDEPLPPDAPTWARIQAAMKELQRGS